MIIIQAHISYTKIDQNWNRLLSKTELAQTDKKCHKLQKVKFLTFHRQFLFLIDVLIYRNIEISDTEASFERYS